MQYEYPFVRDPTNEYKQYMYIRYIASIPNAYLTRLGTDHMAEEDSYNSIHKSDNAISRISSDFQCFGCGAIFTTNEDKKQHLEKEEHGKLH
jgi:hypothetical protein